MKKIIIRVVCIMSFYSIMGILLQAFLANLLLATLSSNAQDFESVTVNVNVVDTPLEDVFQIIEQTTKYKFFYDTDEVTFDKTITIKSENKSLKSILDEIAFEHKLTFKRVNEHIIVKKADQKINQNYNKENGDLTGKVTDSKTGEGLFGCNVWIKGTNLGTATDENGNYFLSIPDGADTLVFSYIGYKTIQLAISDNKIINVSLELEITYLDELVVIGYGTQRKSDLTTSISSLDGEALADEKASNFAEALTGKMAGVQIRQTSGAPGSNINIRVRGASSITAGNNPLYVVDGVPLSNEIGTLSSMTESRNNFQEQPFNPLSSLDIDDIESIQVLKDASSAAIYGSRGSNGVVLITTKKGKKGKPKISYNTYTGFSSILNKIDMMDAYEFAKLHVEAKNTAYLENVSDADINDDNATRVSKGGGRFQIPEELIPYVNGQTGLTNTDWQDEIFRTALTQNHKVSIMGGNDNIKYFSSLNYFDQEGIVIGSNLERFTGRVNLEGKLFEKVKFGINLNPSILKYDLVSSNGPTWNEGVIASALAQAPVFPVINNDGSYNIGLLDWTFLHRGVSTEFVANPIAIANEVKDKMQTNRLIGNTFLGFELLDDLEYKISLGTELNDIRRDFYRPQRLETLFWLRFGPDAVAVTTNTANWLVENTLNYNRSFGQHSFNVLAGYTSQKEFIKITRATGRGFANDLVRTINAAEETNSETREEEWALLSLLLRAQYNYDNKYFLSAALRRDGSSRFGLDNKWGNFPSASVGWRISQENFMKKNNLFDELKLRASYGVTGNFQIPNYGSIALVDQSSYVFGDDEIVNGLTQITAANDELSWERTETIDIGLFSSFWGGLLTLELDYYNSTTSDLLLNVNVPMVSGFTTQLQNIGKVNNKGFEMTLDFQNEFGDFNVKSSLNFAKNINEVKELGPSGDPIFANSGRGQTFITQIGSPIGSYYGYVVEGIYNSEVEIAEHLPTNSGTSRPGDFRFKDLNNDGQITVDDRQIIGDYQPDFTYGFTTSLSYKNLDFSIALQGVEGNKVLNTLRHYIAIPQGGMNNLSSNSDRWKSAENTGNGKTPRANLNATGNNTNISTYHLEDGSYLRVQNITLGYTFPKNLLKKFNIQTLRIYTSVQNPFLFTDYTGYNPEVSSNPTNQLAQGEDFGTYPLARVFTFGLNVNF